jgi:hypothetical protein
MTAGKDLTDGGASLGAQNQHLEALKSCLVSANIPVALRMKSTVGGDPASSGWFHQPHTLLVQENSQSPPSLNESLQLLYGWWESRIESWIVWMDARWCACILARSIHNLYVLMTEAAHLFPSSVWNAFKTSSTAEWAYIKGFWESTDCITESCNWFTPVFQVTWTFNSYSEPP